MHVMDDCLIRMTQMQDQLTQAEARAVAHLLAHGPDMMGLTLAAMAQIFPEDRGQNYALRMGRRAPELMGLVGGEAS